MAFGFSLFFGNQTGGTNATVALTGVAGTGAVGSFTPAISIALTGVAGTGGAGSFTPSLAYTLTGVAGTGGVGAFTPSISVTLTGVEGTGQVGNFTPNAGGNISVSLVGVEATGAVGSFGITIDSAIALVGVAGTGQVGDFIIVGPIPPAPPEEESHGGGFGGGWQWERKRKKLVELRNKQFADDNAERRALGQMVRELVDPPPRRAPGQRDAPAPTPVVINPEVARLLARSKKAGMDEYRQIVDSIAAKVQSDMDDEDDLEVLLMSM